MREQFGDQVKIAADANGRWSESEALANLRALAAVRLAYVEQPVAPGDWSVIDRLAAQSPVPMMLDESVATSDDIARICGYGGRVYAHLKLVKLGGIAPTMRAARELSDADVPFMIGQMNEGAAATAAALHVACATSPAFAELYGADGLDRRSRFRHLLRRRHRAGERCAGSRRHLRSLRKHISIGDYRHGLVQASRRARESAFPEGGV